jgi:hypothetical protein
MSIWPRLSGYDRSDDFGLCQHPHLFSVTGNPHRMDIRLRFIG